MTQGQESTDHLARSSVGLNQSSRKILLVCRRNERRGILMSGLPRPIKFIRGCPLKWSILLTLFEPKMLFHQNWATKNIFPVKHVTGTRNCKLHVNFPGMYLLRYFRILSNQVKNLWLRVRKSTETFNSFFHTDISPNNILLSPRDISF